MKAIYNPPPFLCTVVENFWDGIVLEHLDGGKVTRFIVPLDDSSLIVDPSAEQIAMVEHLNHPLDPIDPPRTDG